MINLYQCNSFPTDYQKDDKLLFEIVCGDHHFDVDPMRYELTDFGHSLEPELVELLVHAETPEEKKVHLETIVQKTIESNDKLESEVSSLRGNIKLRPDAAQTRIEKLIEENLQLFEKINKYQQELDESTNEIEDLTQQIKDATKAKRVYDIQNVQLSTKFRNLRNDHRKLKSDQFSNFQTLRSLLHFCCVQGLKLVTESNNEMDEYFLKKISTAAEDKLVEVAMDIPIHEEEDSVEAEFTIEDFVRILNRKRGAKKETTVEVVEEEDVVEVPSDHPSTRLIMTNPFEKYSQTEVFHSLSLAFDLAGFTIGQDKPYRRIYRGLLDSMISGYSEFLKSEFDEVNEFIKESNSRIRVNAHRFLVREKAVAFVQTEEEERFDVEIQTEEITAAKGKKK